MTTPSLQSLETLLDDFEIAATKRSSARGAFHRGEAWIDDGKASHRTESYLLAADVNARLRATDRWLREDGEYHLPSDIREIRVQPSSAKAGASSWLTALTKRSLN